MGARLYAAPGKEERGGDGEGWVVAEGKKKRLRRGDLAGKFPASSALPGKAFLATSEGRVGLRGRGSARAGARCPGVPCSLGRLPASVLPAPHRALKGKKDPPR